MSYRELRNFIEIMRTLGYPRLVSMDNFRSPNFTLVADILNWLVKRYDPNIELPAQLDNEADRVQFLKLAAHVMYSKARIKLNTKKLYSADGYAVKELLKLATLLHDSMKPKFDKENDKTPSEQSETSLASKITELKTTRALATEITGLGATIYDLLGSEIELRDQRLRSVAKSLDLEDIERSIRMMIREATEEINNLSRKQENLASDQSNLDIKIEKKKADLERNQNRYKSMMSVRPAFMDEYEKLEKELQKLYYVYVDRIRNLEYLESELELYNRSEQEKQEEAQRRLRKSQNKLKGKIEVESSGSDSEVEETKPTRPANGNTQKKVVGNMQGPDSDSDSISEGSDDEVDDDDGIEEDQDSFSDREF